MSRSPKLWTASCGLIITVMIVIAGTIFPLTGTGSAQAGPEEGNRIQDRPGADTDALAGEADRADDEDRADMDFPVSSGGVFAIRRSAGPVEIEVFGAGFDPASWGLDLVKGPGIVVDGLVEDGPAHLAGLERGDILLAVDGQVVDDPVRLAEIIAEREPGDEVDLRYRHGDEERVARARLVEREGSAWLGLPMWNHALPAIHSDLESGVLQRQSEARVAEVLSGSAAQSAGVEVGDRIVGLDGEPLEDVEDLAEAIASRSPGSRLRLTVERSVEGQDEPETMELEATLDAHPEDSSRGFLGVELAIARHIEIIDVNPGDEAFDGQSSRWHPRIPGDGSVRLHLDGLDEEDGILDGFRRLREHWSEGKADEDAQVEPPAAPLRDS